ncbi:MAG: CRISPR-associated protein Cas4 [Candidatus Hydrothermae bacterium]|nr:CRISPR-associated protein Cas4 [Candidatus Hydrothermae bacterium]
MSPSSLDERDLAPEDLAITGTQVAYWMICHRKLWLFSHNLNMEVFSDFVEMGRLLSQERFRKEPKREVAVGRIKLDFLRVGDEVVVHEVKHSRALEEAHVWQVKYYLYALQKLGVPAHRGVIHYPRHMRTLEVTFSSEDRKQIQEALEGIRMILEQEHPPEVERKPFCRTCAYYLFCFI